MIAPKAQSNLTYGELLHHLQSLPQDRLGDNVSVFDRITLEYYPVSALATANDNNDVLDPGHTYLVIES